MATKRQGRTGLFKGTSRPPQKRQTVKDRPSPLAGVTYAWDMIGDGLTWGPGAAEALGLSPKDLPKTGHVFAAMIEPGCGLPRREAIASAQDPGRAYETRYALRLEPDRVVMIEDTGRWQPDVQGRPAFARGLLRIDPASAARDILPARLQARSELLCGIQSSINEALRVSQTCTLIAGAFDEDEADLMADIARRLRPMMRRHDLFRALGPNRFTLTLTCCPAADAVSAMKRLQGLLSDSPAAATLRLGAACAPDHTFKATKLLRFAELALSRGIERDEALAFYTPRLAAPPQADQAPFDWIAALNGRSLALACQPVVDAQSRAPSLMQACAAIPSADPATIPLAPAPGLAGENLALLVDGRLLELAADHLVRNPAQRLALPVSSRTLQDPEWLPMLAAHLGARPGIESRLIVEVPEIALIESRRNLGRLHAMKALGIGLALTGYGAGYITPAQLRMLPVDLLKIDGVFIQPLKRSTDDRLHVRTLIDRAQNLGIAVAAEWVDDEATARLLAAWGVDYLQGALFGEPEAVMQPSAFHALLKRAQA
ncbi:EAL domain-containing protein (putative c-di-GMP-specific phosphodiesterase class I) [Microvirga flocculans]|uniref:EAL domain-containing protein (Putative c-di-GMP-specific phosphodiesterase class I) n=1 Tax=Microvirga flocculans TaxID=217168 RepID=A0A7W6IFQ9_9HYPH|nr:GGDEF domain-containing phosphodiesterase [Microvirga flocculans]MBB4040670.1 EAL domain-containing protein (putative c-di-GMP-specific phosphodiesterase class I) [Microvirga flocculans]